MGSGFLLYKKCGRLFLALSADETPASSAPLSLTSVPAGSSLFRFSAGVFRNSRPVLIELFYIDIKKAVSKDPFPTSTPIIPTSTAIFPTSLSIITTKNLDSSLIPDRRHLKLK